MDPPPLGYSFDGRRRPHTVGCSCHVRERSVLVSPFTRGDYVYLHLHLQHAPISPAVAIRSQRFLETTLPAHILGVCGSFTI